MAINMLHLLVTNSTKELLDTFEQHLTFLPAQEQLELTETDTTLEGERPETGLQLPLYMVDVVVDSERVSVDPSLTVANNIFNQIMDLWEDSVREVKSFISDKIYEPFTKWVSIASFKRDNFFNFVLVPLLTGKRKKEIADTVLRSPSICRKMST